MQLHVTFLRPSNRLRSGFGWLQVADSGIFALRSLSRLQCLGLAGCSGISNGAVGSVSALTSLEELNLEWCTVSVKGGGSFFSLTSSLPPLAGAILWHGNAGVV